MKLEQWRPRDWLYAIEIVNGVLAKYFSRGSDSVHIFYFYSLMQLDVKFLLCTCVCVCACKRKWTLTFFRYIIALLFSVSTHLSVSICLAILFLCVYNNIIRFFLTVIVVGDDLVLFSLCFVPSFFPLNFAPWIFNSFFTPLVREHIHENIYT